MKRIFTIICFLVVVLSSAQTQQGTKVLYTHNFPPAITGDIREQFIKLYEKGRVLYQINCAKCHNTTENGVESMPEFTKADLAKYELRVMNAEHESELAQTKVRAEELYQITLFLTYSIKVEPEKK
jgi:mono/diheme cytochrome c family protein